MNLVDLVITVLISTGIAAAFTEWRTRAAEKRAIAREAEAASATAQREFDAETKAMRLNAIDQTMTAYPLEWQQRLALAAGAQGVVAETSAALQPLGERFFWLIGDEALIRKEFALQRRFYDHVPTTSGEMLELAQQQNAVLHALDQQRLRARMGQAPVLLDADTQAAILRDFPPGEIAEVGMKRALDRLHQARPDSKQREQ